MKYLSKFIFFLLAINSNLFSCTAPIINVPIIDAYVKIDAKNSTTSFNVTWKFKKEFIKSLTPYDKNKNGIFDKDEQEDIKNSFTDYVKEYHYLTDIIYIKKGLKIKKSQLRKFNITDSGLIFSNGEIKYYFNFNVDFILEEDHRLYIRFFDMKSNVNFTLKDIVVNNYAGTKVIEPQNTRANIYFYKYLVKNSFVKDANHCNNKEHENHKH